MNHPLLELRNIETFYGPIMAIRGVSLRIDEGEVVAVLGANGAGKTTLQFVFRALLIEAWQTDVAQGRYRSQAAPQSILQTLAALQVRAGLHVVWCGDHEGAARILEGLVRQFVRGIEKDYQHLQRGSETPAAATGG